MADERNFAYGQYWKRDASGEIVPDDEADDNNPPPVQAEAERLDKDN